MIRTGSSPQASSRWSWQEASSTSPTHLLLMALAVWQIIGDGEAAPFEGAALVALYLVLATIAWFE